MDVKLLLDKEKSIFVAMKRLLCPLCLCLFFLLPVFAPIHAQTATDAVTRFVDREILKHASVGFRVVEVETGRVMASHNEDMSLTPASTMKIITTATAIELLGANYRYRTELLYDGHVENGILDGNVLIAGSGDPTLGSEFIAADPQLFLTTFSDGIQGLGISRITGSIIALDNLFGYEGIPAKWLWEDMGNGYAPGIYGISVFDNLCKVKLSSGAVGKDTEIISVEPHIPDLQLINEVKAAASQSDNSYASGMPFSYSRRLYGTIPQNRASFTAKTDIPDPGLLLAQSLEKKLSEQNITAKEASTYRLKPVEPNETTPIAHVLSPRLGEIIRVINVRSNNHYAEHLYRLLTQVRSVNMKQFWQKRGIDSANLFMYDGCGISPTNALSARFLTDVLSYMDKSYGKSGAFSRSLPKAGQEGTVAGFLKNTPLAGKVYVKSGSISQVQTYAGYVETGEKRYAFAILVNNYTGTRAEVRAAIEQLLVQLFQ